MNWQEILILLVPILGLMGWVYSRIEKKLEKADARIEEMENRINKRFEKVDARIEEMENRIDKRFEEMENRISARFDRVDDKVDNLNMRSTRLEGRFEERGYWESRKTGTHDEKL